MSKYRLSYLENGGYKSIDLSKLECLKGYKVTDIKTIDELTMKFKNYDEFVRFLKRNNIISDTNIQLEITIDKKINNTNNVYNKPIYNSDKLLFSSDEEIMSYDFMLKNIKKHIFDGKYMYNLALNYEEKYKNAYNRITGSSYILEIITIIKVNAIKLYNIGKHALSYNEFNEYENAINNLFNLELYKYDVDKSSNLVRITKKVDKDGNYMKSYRGAHDFVNLLKTLDPTIIKEEELEEREEFLVLNEDFRRINKEIVINYEFNDDIYYESGRDCVKDFESRQEMFAELQRESRRYCLKKGDGRL